MKKTGHVSSKDGMIISSLKNAQSPPLVVLEGGLFNPLADIEIVLTPE